MRNGFLVTVAALLACTGLGLAQTGAPAIQSPAAKQQPGVGGSSGTPTLQPPKTETTTASEQPQAMPAQGTQTANNPPTAEERFKDHSFPEDEAADTHTRFWASAEALLWWIKKEQLPPLVTTGPVSLTPAFPATPPFPGALPSPTSSTNITSPTIAVLFGTTLSEDPRLGTRFEAGYWFCDEHTLGIESSTFFLEKKAKDFTGSSADTPVIARPFIDVSPAGASASVSSVVAFPGVQSGGVHAALSNQFWGTELNATSEWLHSSCYRGNVLAGFRYLEMSEDLGVSEATSYLASVANVPAGTAATSSDIFSTRNFFYGGQFGIDGEFYSGSWVIGARGVIALGDNHEIVDISGNTVVVSPAGVRTALPTGLLAQASNSGHFTRDEFSVIPELRFTVGYQFSKSLRATLGYSLIYWVNSARPGHDVNPLINSTQLPAALFPGSTGVLTGAAQPAPIFDTFNFWAQGISLGLEYRF
jgi:hypothetical protein